MTLAVNRDLAALKEYFAKIEEAKRLGETPVVTKEMISEDDIKNRTEIETQQLHDSWRENTISEHIMYIKGAEIVYFEFKEIIFDMARKLKD